MAQGMFGPSADEMRLLLEQEGQAQDTGWAQMEPGRGPVRGMAQAGRQFGRAIEAAGGYQDPRMAKAKLLEEAKNEVDSMGVSLLDDPDTYYKTAYEALQKRGLSDEAAGVYNLMLSSNATQAKTALDSAKAEAALNKGQPIGKGGLMLPDGTVVPPVSAESDKAQSDIGKLKADLDAGRITQEEYDEKKRKITYIRPENKSDVEVLAGTLGSMADAFRAQAAAKKGGALDAEALDEYAKEATQALSTNQSLDNIESALTTGNTTFGSLADTRRNLMSFVQTFVPGAAKAAENLLKLDVTTFDALEKESTMILAELAKEFGGNRATAAGWQIMQKAGPSVFLTNEGNAITAKGIRKRNQYRIDRQKFIINWQADNNGADIPRWVVSKWEMDNATDPKYTLSAQDFKDIKIIQKKVERIKRLSKKASPFPPSRNLQEGKIYYRTSPETGEPEFYRWNSKTRQATEVD